MMFEESGEAHLGHRHRMRERALTEGFDAFNAHQVIELVLFYAIPRQDVSELAHRLIDRFETVHGVFNASREELAEIEGVGTRVADWLRLLGEACGAYSELQLSDRPRIGNYRSVFEFCRQQKARFSGPTTCQMCLTSAGVIQLFSPICNSLAWGEAEALRDALRSVLSIHARNVIVVEYLEGEEPKPDEDDCRWAQEYADVLRMADVTLLDVVLVGETEILSMSREKLFRNDGEQAIPSVLAENYLREEGEPLTLDDDELPVSDSGL